MFSLRPPIERLPRDVHGRNELIEQLTTKLADPLAWLLVLHGLGGCGKTTVSLEVARRMALEGRRVWWLSAADQATFSSGLRQLVVELGVEPRLVQAAWEGELSAPDLLWRCLDEQETKWLLVIDEADDPMLLSGSESSPGDGTGWLRRSDRGAVLVTTRDGNLDLWRQAVVYPLRELDDRQAVSVLLDQLRDTIALGENSSAELHEAALSLVQALGCLPLALRMAGSFLNVQCRRQLRRGLGAAGLDAATGLVAGAIREYESGLRENIALLDGTKGAGSRHPQIAGSVRVTAIWEGSLRRLDERGMPEAAQLLYVLSCYESVPIPLRVLDTDILAESPILPDDFDEGRRDEVLEALNDFRLAEEQLLSDQQSMVPCVKVHRLVAETVVAQLRQATENRFSQVWSIAALLLVGAAERAARHEGITRWWTVAAPHCLRLLRTCPPGAEEVESLLRLARSAMDVLRAQGSYTDMEAMATAAHELGESHLGPDHVETLACYGEYGRALGLAGRGREATGVLETVWQARERLLGSEHRDTLDTRSRFFDRVCTEGQFTEAGVQLAETARICAQVLGPDHELTLRTRSRHAIALRKQGRWQEAIDEHREVLVRRIAVLGPEHQETMETCNNLGFALAYVGLYEEAERVHRATLDTRSRVLGAEHPQTLLTMSNLASLLRDTGELDEAECLFGIVLAARTRTRGADHPATLITRNNMVLLRVRQGRSADALAEAQDVLRARQLLLGPEHPSVLNSADTLGRVLLDIGELDQAEAVLTANYATRARLAAYGLEHPATLDSALSLAHLCHAQQRHDEGLELAGAALAVWERAEWPQHPKALELRWLTTEFEYLSGRIERQVRVSRLEAVMTLLTEQGLSARHFLVDEISRALRVPDPGSPAP